MGILMALESLDSGKTLEDSYYDMVECVDTLKHFAGWADKIKGTTLMDQNDISMQTRREPYGVVGLITPWNYPLLMSLWKVGPALASGNCVILKPSELTPLTNIYLGNLVKKAGFPAGVVNILVGQGPIVGRYIS